MQFAILRRRKKKGRKEKISHRKVITMVDEHWNIGAREASGTRKIKLGWRKRKDEGQRVALAR